VITVDIRSYLKLHYSLTKTSGHFDLTCKIGEPASSNYYIEDPPCFFDDEGAGGGKEKGRILFYASCLIGKREFGFAFGLGFI